VSTINDGGPAFPETRWDEKTRQEVQWLGMSLRDWFAGQALVGILSNHRLLVDIDENSPKSTREAAVDYALAVADTVLKARGQRQSQYPSPCWPSAPSSASPWLVSGPLSQPYGRRKERSGEMSKKLLLELDIEVDGKISEERLREVLQMHFSEYGSIVSERNGDGDAYFISINSVEVKEVK